MSTIDHTLQLEAVYYSAPVPRNLAVLNVLGVVFDRVHFPGVYLPFDDFDVAGVQAEITRLEGLSGLRRTDTGDTAGLLRFLLDAAPLKDMLVFEPTASVAFQNSAPARRLAEELYQSIHGPNPPGWEPIISGAVTKGLAGDADMTWQGDYTYMAGALLRSAERKLPLVNDIAGLPVPDAAGAASPETLAAMLAIESVLTTLPELPLLPPQALADFRGEAQPELRAFRSAMLRYAGQFHKDAKGLDEKALQEALNLFVKTEIVPALDELRRLLERPARPWYKSLANIGVVSATLTAAVITGKETSPVTAALAAFAPQFLDELVVRADKNDAVKRSSLYYLIKLRHAVDRAAN